MIKLHVKLTLLTYALTNVIGSALIAPAGIRGLHYHEVLVLSLIFSSPAVVVLFFNYFMIQRMRFGAPRIAWSLISISLLCLAISMLFIQVIEPFPVFSHDVLRILLSHSFSALLVFTVVSRQLIFQNSTVRV